MRFFYPRAVLSIRGCHASRLACQAGPQVVESIYMRSVVAASADRLMALACYPHSMNIVDSLARAEMNVAVGEERVAEARRQLAASKRDRRDSTLPERVLATLEEVQLVNVEYRDELRDELDRAIDRRQH